MRFKARYEINNTSLMKGKILKAVRNMIGDDTYYADQGWYGVVTLNSDNTTSKLTHSHMNRKGDRFYSVDGYDAELDKLSEFVPTWEWINNQRGGIGWLTCANNLCHVLVKGDYVTLTLDGRRHGVKKYFHFFSQFSYEELEYVSERKDASPFTCGLSPPLEPEPPDESDLYIPASLAHVYFPWSDYFTDTSKEE